MQTDSLAKLVVIGLGSNQNSIINLRRALLEIRRESNFKILKVSRIYESSAQLPNQAPADWDQAYLNAAVLVEVQSYDSQGLLRQLKAIEVRLGRLKTEKWAPRIIDLDILFVKDFNFHTKNLHIPHPMLAERPFAFLPGLEVYSDMHLIKKDNLQAYNTRISDRYFWPEFVAILNVTPDSFSDGGKYTEREKFLQQARQLIADGADYLDVGAESTRPMAETISHTEEMLRLNWALNLLEELKKEDLQFKVSIDSRNYETVREVVQNYKIDLINDVSGLFDYKMLDLIKEYNFSAVCMHSLSVPANKEIVLKSDCNPVQEISNWWTLREKIFSDYNIKTDNIFFDPGFGFGKTTEQSRYLVNHLEDFCKIQHKFFLGYSRKSFLSYSNERKNAHMDLETSLVTQKINPAFCQLLRVHDIETQKIALRMSNAI
ncbi:MAG: dihydropteroate synthase [Bdellovibrionaceae bacterium]|nr:dihydropteroate synthase [Pseudobdellovibrionaceae bacterium]